jgi:hypothetical protein
MAGSGNLNSLNDSPKGVIEGSKKSPFACFNSPVIVTETQYHYNSRIAKLGKIAVDLGAKLRKLFSARSLRWVE